MKTVQANYWIFPYNQCNKFTFETMWHCLHLLPLAAILMLVRWWTQHERLVHLAYK